MTRRRQDALTAGVGMAGVGTAAHMRHTALDQAYPDVAGKSNRPTGFPRNMFAERKFRHTKAGRNKYGAAVLLGAAATTPAAVGLNNLIRGHPKEQMIKRDKGRIRNDLKLARSGVSESMHQRKKTLVDPAPVNRQAQSLAVGAGIGSLSGWGVHSALRKVPRKFGGHKAAAASLAGLGAGIASLPAQDRLMGATSRGKYKVTPAGVARTKKARVPASSQANQVQRINGQEVPARVAKVRWGKKPPGKVIGVLRDPQRRSARPDSDAVQAVVDRARKNRGVPEQWFAKADYPGSTLTSGQKRRRVLATGTTPVVGDLAAAGLAGRMAPPNLRRKTEALQLSGSVGGSAVGGAVGAYGAAGLVKQIPQVRGHAESLKGRMDRRVKDPISRVQEKAGHKVHPKLGKWLENRHAPIKPGDPPRGVAGHLKSLSEHRRPGFARAGRVLSRAHAPLVGAGAAAALGAMAGQSAGSTAGSSITYGHALKLEDKQRGKKIVHKSTDNRHGSRISKLAPSPGMSRREEKQTAHRKRQSAVLSATSGTSGLAALGALAGTRVKRLGPKVIGHLRSSQVPLLTGSSGISGINAFKYSSIQRKEAKELDPVRKSLGMPAIPNPARIAPVKPMMPRQGHLVRTRTATGIKTSTRRGVI